MFSSIRPSRPDVTLIKSRMSIFRTWRLFLTRFLLLITRYASLLVVCSAPASAAIAIDVTTSKDSVTITDTAPTADRYNLSIVAILPNLTQTSGPRSDRQQNSYGPLRPGSECGRVQPHGNQCRRCGHLCRSHRDGYLALGSDGFGDERDELELHDGNADLHSHRRPGGGGELSSHHADGHACLSDQHATMSGGGETNLSN